MTDWMTDRMTDRTTGRGLFLDLDGTLADSLGAMKEAFFSFHADRGLPCTENDFQALNGPTLGEVVSRIRIRYRLHDSVDSLLAEYLAGVQTAYRAVRVAEGGEELVRSARAGRWACAVVTSSSETLARGWLRSAGLEVYFDTVIGMESVAEGKPSPAPYRAALAQTGADPALSFAVEDSTSGLASARGAGLFTFFLGDAGVVPSTPLSRETSAGFAAIRSLRELLPRIAG
jgi:beta-phosphoglucomutase-like phosphatase (HAD superfamily)